MYPWLVPVALVFGLVVGAGATVLIVAAHRRGTRAVAVASILRGVTEHALTVALRGGELELEWPSEGGAVYMTGPAVEVFTGQFLLEGE